MSGKDSEDICTDGDFVEEVPMTRFSNLNDKETLLIEKPQSKISDCLTKKDLMTVPAGKMSPMITISKEQYEYLCAELRSKDQKLKALKNIHFLIQEKDQEVSSLKERNQTYADALMMSEVRHCQLLRIATRFAKEKSGSDTDQKQKTCSMSDSAEEISDQGLNKSSHMVSQQDSEIDNPKDNIEHTLEEDSEILNNEAHASEIIGDSARRDMSLEADAALVLDGLACTYLKRDLKETDDDALNRIASDDAVQKTVEREGQTESLQHQVLKPRGLPMPRYALPRKFPGVSQDLINKLITQNARLKQILRQVMSSQGYGVEDYLDRQEYASVVEQLRQELKLSKNRVKDLEELMASVESQDTDGLTTRNLQLQDMLQRQNKMLAVKQAMIDAFSRRCDEMEHELKQVKLNSLTEDESSLSRNKQEITASARIATKTGHAPLLVSSAVVSAVGIRSSLICKRCDREFDESDDEKYREHCTKCTDD